MKYRIFKTGLIAVTLVLAAGLASADADKAVAGTKNPSGSPAAVSTKGSTKDSAKDAKANVSKAAAKMKWVDINSASKAELKTLPGIGDAEAAKIIAGRPYGSKAFLVTRNIIPRGVYEGVKMRIIARQK